MIAVTDDALATLTEAVVRIADPRLVLLFGSQARGTAGEDSDVDLLIVGDRPADGSWSRRLEIGKIRRALPRLGVGIDILLFTPEEVEQWRGSLNHVIGDAFREGKVLYERG